MKKTTAKPKISRDLHLVSSDTPWGKAQTAEDVAPGIVRYSTASHGGYRLSSALNAKVAPVLKKATCAGLGSQGWYEEDCDWAIVVYTFKEYFDPPDYKAAVETLKQHHAEPWKQLLKNAK